MTRGRLLRVLAKGGLVVVVLLTLWALQDKDAVVAYLRF